MADRNQNRGRSYLDRDQEWDRFDERRDFDRSRGSSYSGAGYGRNLEDDYTQDVGRGDYGTTGGRYGANYGGGRYGGREQGWGRGEATGSSNAGRNYGGGFDNPYGSRYYESGFGASDDYGRYAGSQSDDERYRTASGRYGSRDEGRREEDRRAYGAEDRDREPGWWDRTRNEVSSWFRDEDRDRDVRTGEHRGKGPKGYRRSEERIREDVCERLSYDDRIDASDIDVQVQGDEVVLAGTVHDREQKRRAEDLVESISGVRNVENRIRVDRGAERTMQDYTGNTDEVGGVGRESGTTNEVIRDARKESGRKR